MDLITQLKIPAVMGKVSAVMKKHFAKEGNWLLEAWGVQR